LNVRSQAKVRLLTALFFLFTGLSGHGAALIAARPVPGSAQIAIARPAELPDDHSVVEQRSAVAILPQTPLLCEPRLPEGIFARALFQRPPPSFLSRG
jgi:hypothetical protein